MAETDPSVKVWETEFTALDLETTGLDPLADRVVEVGAVVFSPEVPCSDWEETLRLVLNVNRLFERTVCLPIKHCS